MITTWRPGIRPSHALSMRGDEAELLFAQPGEWLSGSQAPWSLIRFPQTAPVEMRLIEEEGHYRVGPGPENSNSGGNHQNERASYSFGEGAT